MCKKKREKIHYRVNQHNYLNNQILELSVRDKLRFYCAGISSKAYVVVTDKSNSYKLSHRGFDESYTVKPR